MIMEEDNYEIYHVGQHAECFVDTEWTPCLITSVLRSDPPQYGLTTIMMGKSYFLGADSVRPRIERRLLAEDSFQESNPVDEIVHFEGTDFDEQINFSLLSSDDESIFITQSNPVHESPEQSVLEDSLIDFARDAELGLTLSSPSRDDMLGSVNGCQLPESPVNLQPEVGSVNGDPIPCNDNHSISDSSSDEIDDNLVYSDFDKDMQEFVDSVSAVPQKKTSVRFADVVDAEIESLKKASKSERTHKQTQWGVNILIGN